MEHCQQIGRSLCSANTPPEPGRQDTCTRPLSAAQLDNLSGEKCSRDQAQKYKKCCSAVAQQQSSIWSSHVSEEDVRSNGAGKQW